MSDFGGSGDSWVTVLAMRRALARARDGKPLDPDEATVLLHARGEDMQTLLAYASRTRDVGLERAFLGLRRPAVLAGFGELNPQIPCDVPQTALAGPPIPHLGYQQGAGAAFGS